LASIINFPTRQVLSCTACHGVSDARQRGSLYLPEEDALLWDSLSRMVAEADRQALTSIDFWLPR